MKKEQIPKELRTEFWFEDCREGEVEECYYYEFARASESYRNDIRATRERLEKEFKWVTKEHSESRQLDFDELLRRAHLFLYRPMGDGYFPNGMPFRMFTHSPEFPKKPFLEITPPERGRRIYKVRTFRELVFDPDPVFPGMDTGFIDIPVSFLEGGAAWLTKHLGAWYPTFAVKAFVYDDSLSPTALGKRFERWLERQKREKAKERRGNTGERYFRAQLKKLGAVRLLRHVARLRDKGQLIQGEKDWQAASRLYANSFGDKKTYSNQSAWSRAKGEVEEILRRDFTI